MSHRGIFRWMKRLLVLAVLVGAVAYGIWFFDQNAEGLPRYQTGKVTRGELSQVVTASGQLNPVTMVEVGSQISGNIQQLLVDFNSTVTNGQIVALIDPATLEANALQAEGDLDNARATLESAQNHEQRAKTLRGDKLNTQAEYEDALAVLHQAEANMKIKEAALKSAKVNLARCTIYSPIDGLVLSRNVNVGQTVAASLSAPTLFVIANDLSKMQIEANVAEADIGVVEAGQEAEFGVDAFPGKIFHGKVRQIRNAPKTDQNVVTYGTIIEVNNAELKLKPGMTATVSIIVARHDDALRIPNAALRFQPVEDGSKTARAKAKRGSDDKRKSDPDSISQKKNKRKQERLVYLLCTQSSLTNSPALTLQPASIKVGINNSTFTEVLDGLKEGDEVITGLVSSKNRPVRKFNPFANFGRK
jgi:HlyD family secretion protein